ncbi:NFAT activation molecule 1 isoform X2 [Ambystoma mexicanum]|uniref:NFAT activation molecule 1 isoform X2 n=1 Tax=Ambystoma mexicanum TaxID=8296 RepID=UPI0037E8B1A7
MASATAFAAIFLLTFLYTGGSEVFQTPAILAALSEEHVHVTCKITFPVGKASIMFAIYRIESQGQEIFVTNTSAYQTTTLQLENTTIVQKFKFQPKKSLHFTGNCYYYCVVTAPWLRQRELGPGTFLHIRETGYVRKPQSKQNVLSIFLIITCTVLAALSLTGTALLLLWAKKGYPTWSSLKQRGMHGGHNAETRNTTDRPEASTSDSIYTILEHNTTDVYETLEQKAKFQSPDSKQLGQILEHNTTDVYETLEQKAKFQSPDSKRLGQQPQVTPWQLNIKSLTGQAARNKTANKLPSTSKYKQKRKKSPEEPAGGQKEAAGTKPQPAAAKEDVFDTLYENL